MINSQIEEWKKAAQDGTIPDEQNPLFIFSLTSNALLIKIATGELDVLKIVLYELGSRGYDNDGEYIGFIKK